MAGLALVVSDLPEIRRIVEVNKNGMLVDKCNEKEIAKTINMLNRDRINEMKRRSLEAAKHLNWESEQYKFLNLVDNCLK